MLKILNISNYMNKQISNKTQEHIFNGHIVHCKDLDGGDEFNVQVMVNELHEIGGKIEVIEKAIELAEKHELTTLSGNTFEFEYIQPSGRIVRKTVKTEITELSPISPEAEEILEQREIE
jgi:hypothetical protein